MRGRVPMLLNSRTADGRTVILPPFVVSLQVERAAGVELFQIILTTSSTLGVRLQSRAGADPDHVWDEVRAKLVRMLFDHGLSHVAVDRATEPPELSSGDKFRLVIPLIVHGRSGCWRNGDGVVLRRRGQGRCVRLHLAAITGRGSICVPCRSVAGVNRCTYWYALTRPRAWALGHDDASAQAARSRGSVEATAPCTPSTATLTACESVGRDACSP